MSDEEVFEGVEEARRNTRAIECISKSAALAQAFRLEPALYALVQRVDAIVVLENRDAAYSQFKRDLVRLSGMGPQGQNYRPRGIMRLCWICLRYF